MLLAIFLVFRYLHFSEFAPPPLPPPQLFPQIDSEIPQVVISALAKLYRLNENTQIYFPEHKQRSQPI